MKYFALLLLDFPCSDKSLVCASGKPFAGAVSNNVSSDCSCGCSFHMGIRIFISLVLPATLLVRDAILIMLLSQRIFKTQRIFFFLFKQSAPSPYVPPKYINSCITSLATHFVMLNNKQAVCYISWPPSFYYAYTVSFMLSVRLRQEQILVNTVWSQENSLLLFRATNSP